MVSMITAYYPPLAWLMAFAVQDGSLGWMQGVAFLIASLALIGLIALIFGKSYIPLALKQSETMQSMNAQGKKCKQAEKQRSPFWALYRLEMRTILQSPAYATNGLTGLVMCPLIIGVVVMSITSQKGGTDLLKMITTELPSELYLLAILAVFLMGCLLSITVGTAVTREGRTLIHRRTFPVSPIVALGAKLSTGLMINFVTVLPCGVALMVLLPQWWMVTLIAIITSQLFSVAICLINLAMDVYFPKLLWKSETEAIKKSLNALFSMLISTVVIGLAGVIVWFVGIERQAGIWMGYGVMNAFLILMVTVFSLWFYKHVPKVYATKGYQT